MPRGPSGRIIATETIGPDGGVVAFDGGQLEIPSGALTERVTIEVRTAAIDDRLRVRTGGAEVVVAAGDVSAFRFAPAGLTFATPATLTFDIPQDAPSATVFTRTDGDDRSIRPIRSDIDEGAGTASVRIGDLGFGR